MIKTKLALLFLIFTSIVNACNCNNSVMANYQKIILDIPVSFTPVKLELQKTILELEKTKQLLNKEIKLIKKSIENKSKLTPLLMEELHNLKILKAHLENQSDIKISSSKIELETTKELIYENNLEEQNNKNINNTTKKQ